ncbi:MAG: ABC transporter permease [Christensenellales bacterium]|jgi:putative aldouronate transport system permease protein
MQRPIDKSAQNNKRPKKKRRLYRDDVELTLLALPTAIWYIVFCYMPMFGIIIAFKDFKITPGKGFFFSLFTSEWVGLSNFDSLYASGRIWILLRNTICYNIVFIILGIIVPVTLAIMTHLMRNQRGGKVYQTMMFFPHFLSWVVVSYFVYAFINPRNGLIISYADVLGIPSRLNLYREPRFWVWAFPLINLWKTVGYGMVVYLAAITGIDVSLYEAALIDGANKRQQVRYITLPSIRPMIIIMFILNVGRIFYSDFGLFYQVTQGIPLPLRNVADTLDTYVFRSLTSNASLGKIAAPTFIQSVACCITILIANAIVRKVDSDSALI